MKQRNSQFAHARAAGALRTTKHRVKTKTLPRKQKHKERYQ